MTGKILFRFLWPHLPFNTRNQTSFNLHKYIYMRTMTARQSSPTSDHSHSDGNVRKRVCKACDRCRLKKSKVSQAMAQASACPDALTRCSVTDPTHVVGAGQIMPSVSLARGRRLTTKCTPRGELAPIRHVISIANLALRRLLDMSRCLNNNKRGWSMAFKKCTVAPWRVKAGRESP